MKRYAAQSLIFPLILVLCLASQNRLLAYPDKGTVITVNDVGDTVDAAPGDGVCADAAGKCTLRAAIAESNATDAMDAIIFDVPVPAVINLTLGELLITKYVVILGRGARSLTIQRTAVPNSSNFRVFHLSSLASLRGMTIQNGNSFGAGGGILAEAGLFLADVAVKGNRATSGGGIAFQGAGGGQTGIQRCLISSNMTTGQGGGIYVAPGMSALVLSSTFTNNSAADGGAIANFGSTTLVNDTITQNSASQSSSSILSSAGHSVGLINTIIGPDIGQAQTHQIHVLVETLVISGSIGS